jgi:hypothetical protein
VIEGKCEGFSAGAFNQILFFFDPDTFYLMYLLTII